MEKRQTGACYQLVALNLADGAWPRAGPGCPQVPEGLFVNGEVLTESVALAGVVGR